MYYINMNIVLYLPNIIIVGIQSITVQHIIANKKYHEVIII